jgi:hypothetical protein
MLAAEPGSFHVNVVRKIPDCLGGVNRIIILTPSQLAE